MTDDPLRKARSMLTQARSWHELRRRLDAEGLIQRLGSAAMVALLTEWHQREAAALDDTALIEELEFWAAGGRRAEHMRGYNAVPPLVLVEEARARGWFVRHLQSGSAIVNPPDGKPLQIKPVVG